MPTLRFAVASTYNVKLKELSLVKCEMGNVKNVLSFFTNY